MLVVWGVVRWAVAPKCTTSAATLLPLYSPTISEFAVSQSADVSADGGGGVEEEEGLSVYSRVQ